MKKSFRIRKKMAINSRIRGDINRMIMMCRYNNLGVVTEEESHKEFAIVEGTKTTMTMRIKMMMIISKED